MSLGIDMKNGIPPKEMQNLSCTPPGLELRDLRDHYQLKGVILVEEQTSKYLGVDTCHGRATSVR